VTLPMSALDGLVDATATKQVDGPGPFAFANPDKVRNILQGAGFSQITMTPFDGEMAMGSPRGLEAAAAYIAEIGPVARALAELPKERRPEVIKRLEAIVTPMMRGDSLVLQGGVWVVEAVRAA
jgi:hypothetical protein